jgi:histidinol dehydrogenase
MKRINYDELPPGFFSRGADEDVAAARVREIVARVKERGDEAVREFTRILDGVDLDRPLIGSREIELGPSRVSAAVLSAMEKAVSNIRCFAGRQMRQYEDFDDELETGVFVGQRIVPIDRVGIYVPGGRYPLFSSLLMAAVPARVAGVKEVVVCSPPRRDGSLPEAVLAAASLAGVDEIYMVGGAQAIAAMAFGTASLRRVDKIVGPGNVYVSAAKRLVCGNTGIDFVAGPTEILIIADGGANPSFVAADLIAQAEHDADARAVLATDSTALADAVALEIEAQLARLETAAVARTSLESNGLIIHLDDLADGAELANRMAPEHLELQIDKPEWLAGKLKHYGSLFLGALSAEALGDYSSGLNHILPTGAAARFRGGLNVGDFIKIQTVLRVEATGIAAIGPAACSLAEAEGLPGHARSLLVRLGIEDPAPDR